MNRHPNLLLAALIAVGVASLACFGGTDAAEEEPEPAIILLREDVFVVGQDEVSSGPRISGTIEAAVAAVLRAEVGGSVTEVAVDVGQPVKAGDVLARIENQAAGSGYASARTSVASAQSQVAQAERELERAKRLFEAGALAPRDVEVAERQLEAARAQLDAAGAQRAAAGDQAEATVVRSPISGVVGTREVSIGDVVGPGTPLFTVIEPTSLRFEGSVPATASGQIAVGDAVKFTVTGHEEPYHGVIERIAPSVDPRTRQIPVIVSLDHMEGLIVGLFASGRVAAQQGDGMVVPLDAVRKVGDQASVLRFNSGTVEEVPIQIGVEDDAGERVVVTSGLQSGDIVLVGGAREAVPGSRAELRLPEGEG